MSIKGKKTSDVSLFNFYSTQIQLTFPSKAQPYPFHETSLAYPSNDSYLIQSKLDSCLVFIPYLVQLYLIWDLYSGSQSSFSIYLIVFPWASLVAQSLKVSACNAGDLGSSPGSGRSPGEGNGNDLYKMSRGFSCT